MLNPHPPHSCHNASPAARLFISLPAFVLVAARATGILCLLHVDVVNPPCFYPQDLCTHNCCAQLVVQMSPVCLPSACPILALRGLGRSLVFSSFAQHSDSSRPADLLHVPVSRPAALPGDCGWLQSFLYHVWIFRCNKGMVVTSNMQRGQGVRADESGVLMVAMWGVTAHAVKLSGSCAGQCVVPAPPGRVRNNGRGNTGACPVTRRTQSWTTG